MCGSDWGKYTEAVRHIIMQNVNRTALQPDTCLSNTALSGSKLVTDFLFHHLRQGHSSSREQTAVAAVAIASRHISEWPASASTAALNSFFF